MLVGKFHQFHTAIASSFASLLMGLLNSWPSYTSEIYLSNTTTPLSSVMTKTEEALLGSLPSLGAMLGTALVGLIMNSLGRRYGGVVTSIPILISWTMISLTTSIKLVLVARFIGGFSGGASLVLAPIFVSEVAEDSIRGLLASASVYLYCGGLLLSYIMGFFMAYKTIIWMNLLLTAVNFILLILVTESPVYLLRQKREQDARVSIAKYRGLPVSSKVVIDEITKIKLQIVLPAELLPATEIRSKEIHDSEKKMLHNEEFAREKQDSMSAFKLLFLQPASRWAFIVMTTLITLQVFMGSTAIQVYAKSVFQQTDPTKADIYTIIYAAVLFSGSLFAALVADKAGRKVLIISSSVIVFLCMSGLGYLLQIKTAPPIVTVSLIFAYCFFYIYGAGTVPYILLAEVFMSEVQDLASLMIIEWTWFLNFVIIAVFPFLIYAFEIHGTFYIFACMGLANAIISYFIVPETKGLSHSQIQDLLCTRKRNNYKFKAMFMKLSSNR